MSDERERRSLDGLLLLPMERREILRIKWLAGCWYLRPAGVVILLYLVAGAAAQIIHPLGAVLMGGALFVHLLFFGTLGLWLSVFCRSSLQAKVILGVVVFALTLGPSMMCLGGPFSLPITINPVECWYSLCFGWSTLSEDRSYWHRMQWCLLNVLLYGEATCILWLTARRRFSKNPFNERASLKTLAKTPRRKAN